MSLNCARNGSIVSLQKAFGGVENRFQIWNGWDESYILY